MRVAVLALLLLAHTPVVTAGEDTPKTSTGFYYPIGVDLGGDANWGACGSEYSSGSRHLGADLFYDSGLHDNRLNIGRPVYAVSRGTVVAKSGPAECSGWGIDNYGLAIEHKSTRGDFVAVYGHIRTALHIGDKVSAGQEIGTIAPYIEHESYGRGAANQCEGQGDLITRKSHLHFGIYDSSEEMPKYGWGRIRDEDCDDPDETRGFVNPLAFLRTRVPKNR